MAQYFMRRFHSHSTVIQDTLKIGQKYSIVPRARKRVSERANESAKRSARAKRAVRSKRTNEWCERMSEQMSEWPSANVPISRDPESQCGDGEAI